MKDELRGIAIAFAIMAVIVSTGYAFTAAVGPGPTSGSMSGAR